RALGDGANVDSGKTKSRKESCRHTLFGYHAVADHGNNRAGGRDMYGLNLPVSQLRFEFLLECLPANFGFGGWYRDANRVFGTGLRNQNHTDTRFAKSSEKTLCYTRYTDHSG